MLAFCHPPYLTWSSCEQGCREELVPQGSVCRKDSELIGPVCGRSGEYSYRGCSEERAAKTQGVEHLRLKMMAVMDHDT